MRTKNFVWPTNCHFRFECYLNLFIKNASQKKPSEEIRNYFHDYNVTNQLTRSQTTEDFGIKPPDTNRFNKHTACTENEYVIHHSKRVCIFVFNIITTDRFYWSIVGPSFSLQGGSSLIFPALQIGENWMFQVLLFLLPRVSLLYLDFR